jgi:putative SOS response-associated peptidase YedK
MCSHYEAPTEDRLLSGFGVAPTEPYQHDLWPTYLGPFIRLRVSESTDDDQSEVEAQVGQFGLLPFWSKDRNLGRRTFNARSETVSSKPSFRDAWKKGQHCVILAAGIYESDWRSGQAVPTRITRSDDGVMAIAGLWDEWHGPNGRLLSFTMLTVNAQNHFMNQYHKPDDEKRSVVILPNGLINDWLHASPEHSMEFMRLYPGDKLKAEPRPK